MLSCRDEFIFEVDEPSTNLNFVSELSTDLPVSAVIFTTVAFGSNQGAERPNEATVLFSGTDLPIRSTVMTFNDDMQHYELGRFDFKPSQGNFYEVTAFIPNSDYDTLSARTYIPMSGAINNVTTLSIDTFSASANQIKYRAEIEITLAEPREYPSYFQIIPKRIKTNFRVDGNDNLILTDLNEMSDMKITGINSNRNAVTEFTHKPGVFVDYSRLTDDKIRIQIETSEPLNRHSEILRLLNIQLNTLSPDLYTYHTFLHNQLLSNRTNFAFPVNSFSNVDNGLGIFGGFSTVRVIIPL